MSQTTALINLLAIDGCRLNQAIAELATIGALPTGGVQRLAFSPEDRDARALVQHWMETTGMTTTIDAAGNLIGHYPGHCPEAPTIATGSHLDTVPHGGLYDGAYGVIAGLEVIRTLYDHKMRLNHPIEVIVFADEERTMIGSKGMVSKASQEASDYNCPSSISIQTRLKQIGGNWDKLPLAQRKMGSLAAFVELHVEQGPVMESMGSSIGLVTGIVGQRRYLISIEGQSSHAGTTPMSMRCDALVAASQIVLAVNQIGHTRNEIMGGEQVATVGLMELMPNVVNTIPGKVEMVVDMRDLSNDCLDQMVLLLKAAIEAIATSTQTKVTIQPRLRNEPAPASSHIYNAIAQVCEELDLDTCALPSRASHDAQNMACITDMGMIFVPSQSGLSHTAAEYTTPEHCIQGANVLLHTLIHLDQHYRCCLDSRTIHSS